jgi:4-carboxymuconolactone decarboxylase
MEAVPDADEAIIIMQRGAPSQHIGVSPALRGALSHHPGIALQDTAVLHPRMTVTNGGVTKAGAFEPGTIKAKHQRKGQTMSEDSLFERGLKVRKEVLGEDYVNKSIAGADEFTRTMAEWSTEFCWGALWTRPGFDRRSRSIVNLAMISVLNRPHELKLHVKAALKNGLTKDEIKEIFLQVAVYAGVPAGIDSFRIAREAFKEVETG